MSHKRKVFLIWLTAMTLFVVTSSAAYHAAKNGYRVDNEFKTNATDQLFKTAIP
jgi:hypothetical protein